MSERMTIDDVEAFRTDISAGFRKLAEFYPLFREKHERWTAEAYERAVNELAETCVNFLNRLEEAAKEPVSKLRVVEKE
jgi:hypothetical protein